MQDVESVLRGITTNNTGGFVLSVLLLVFGPAAILSEKTAEKFGLLGVAARWFRNAKKRAIEKDQELQNLRVQSLIAEIEELDRSTRFRIDRLATELETISEREAEATAYIVYAAEYYRRVDIWAAENGLLLPPPPLQSFRQWRLAREREHRQDDSEE